MRRKNESVFECLERKGFKQIGGPKDGNFSVMVPGAQVAVYARGDERFMYGIRMPSASTSVGALSPVPKCCSDYKPLVKAVPMPKWARSVMAYLSGETKRARIRAEHRAEVLSWLRMDINAEISKARQQINQA